MVPTSFRGNKGVAAGVIGIAIVCGSVFATERKKIDAKTEFYKRKCAVVQMENEKLNQEEIAGRGI